MTMKTHNRFVVLGGVGTIGKIVVRDLFESNPNNQIIIADYKVAEAEKLATSFNNERVCAKFLDANKLIDVTNLLRESQAKVVINCLQHDFNLTVMTAAYYGDSHYVDLGGLFSWTRKQLKFNKIFERAGLTAVIGMGCSPGITNILAAYAVGQLGKVRSIKIRVGLRDFNPSGNDLSFGYSAQTIIEELTLRPWVFCDGKFQQVSPRTGWELTQFPKPVGKTWTLWTRHSEVATLPLTFRKQGLKYCDFKVSFDRNFVAEVMKRQKSGWTLSDFKKLVKPTSNPNDYEISRVIVDDLIIDCHAKAKPEWNASAGDIDTGCPPSIVAQMIANGFIDPGVSPPETSVPMHLFFEELEKRGMVLKVHNQPLHH